MAEPTFVVFFSQAHKEKAGDGPGAVTKYKTADDQVVEGTWAVSSDRPDAAELSEKYKSVYPDAQQVADAATFETV